MTNVTATPATLARQLEAVKAAAQAAASLPVKVAFTTTTGDKR